MLGPGLLRRGLPRAARPGRHCPQQAEPPPTAPADLHAPSLGSLSPRPKVGADAGLIRPGCRRGPAKVTSFTCGRVVDFGAVRGNGQARPAPWRAGVFNMVGTSSVRGMRNVLVICPDGLPGKGAVPLIRRPVGGHCQDLRADTHCDKFEPGMHCQKLLPGMDCRKRPLCLRAIPRSWPTGACPSICGGAEGGRSVGAAFGPKAPWRFLPECAA